MCQQPLCEFSVMAFGLLLCVCVCVCSECACCSRVCCLVLVLYCLAWAKLPARWENNAHKRLSEEASGADVFHVALNGAAVGSGCVCVRVLYMLTTETEEKKSQRKRPLQYVS